MYNKEGIKGLFRGNAVNCSIQAPFTALEFFFYDYYKQLVFPQSASLESRTPTFFQKMVSGGLSGMTATMLIYPADLLKTFVITT